MTDQIARNEKARGPFCAALARTPGSRKARSATRSTGARAQSISCLEAGEPAIQPHLALMTRLAARRGSTEAVGQSGGPGCCGFISVVPARVAASVQYLSAVFGIAAASFLFGDGLDAMRA